ncbi:vancomycin high temperature exclusion protein [Kitasatospora sp. NPDC052868]|uniref:vancomycin high temperature exclusion protein n=1 Tax=Kitasatospora sp. NPDC052868 TaxID=3364060 RepID=UPI0037C85548
MRFGSGIPGLLLRRVRRLGVRLRRRRAQRRIFQLATVFCCLALAPSAWLWIAGEGRVGSVESAPKAPVAVVFGAGLYEGRPSPYLAHRLDAAVDLYRLEKVQAILVTGDNGRDGYDETDAMRRYLIEHGVPQVRVVGDHAGFDTWDSCTRARRIFGVDRAVLVSQDFHVRRALALCQAAGIDAYAVGVPEVHDLTWLYGGVREIPGAGKAALNAWLRPDPVFLGPQEQGIPRALADAAAAGPR